MALKTVPIKPVEAHRLDDPRRPSREAAEGPTAASEAAAKPARSAPTRRRRSPQRRRSVEKAPPRAADRKTTAPIEPESLVNPYARGGRPHQVAVSLYVPQGSELRSSAPSSARRGYATPPSRGGCLQSFTSERQWSAMPPPSSSSAGCASRPARKVPTLGCARRLAGCAFSRPYGSASAPSSPSFATSRDLDAQHSRFGPPQSSSLQGQRPRRKPATSYASCVCCSLAILSNRSEVRRGANGFRRLILAAQRQRRGLLCAACSEEVRAAAFHKLNRAKALVHCHNPPRRRR